MSSIIKVGKVQSSTGQDAIEIANDGTITANGAIDSLKTDTISEKTSANGVSIDGLKIKDYSLMYGSNIGLTVSSDGYITKPNQPMFLAKGSVKQEDLPVNTYNTINFATEIFDRHNDYDTSTSTFTAPITGAYQVQVQLYLEAIDQDALFYQCQITGSNRTLVDVKDFNRETGSSDPDYWSLFMGFVLDMDANDTAKIQVYQGNGAAQTDVSASSFFSGFLIG